MFYATPRETRHTMFYMARTAIDSEHFTPDEVLVMVAFTSDIERGDYCPSWMNVQDAIESTHISILLKSGEEDFNAELAKLVNEYGMNGVSGDITTVPIEVVTKPERKVVHETGASLRMKARESLYGGTYDRKDS